MKKIVMYSILSIFLSNVCFAELYVVIDKATKEVVTVSEKNDTVPGSNQEIKVVSGNITDFTDEHPSNYKLNDGKKFVKNLDKIDKQEQAKVKEAKLLRDMEKVEKELRKIAIKSLKDNGVTLEELKEE